MANDNDPFAPWTDERRLEQAKQRTDRLVTECTNLIWTHQNIRKLVMSPAVASQIPRSYAAHAFTSFQHDLVGLEIVRLCAIWDRARRTRLASLVFSRSWSRRASERYGSMIVSLFGGTAGLQ